MNENKSLFLEIAETIDRHLSKNQVRINDLPSLPSRLRRFLRWLTPNGGTLLLVAALIVTAQVWAKPLTSSTNAPGPSAITVNYQGRLADSDGIPLDGTYGMDFSLWDAATDGNLIWPTAEPEDHSAVPVSEGLFSVGLGSQTDGGIPTTTWNGDRYLEIIVGGETLSPRELIRSVPIAGIALTVPDGTIGASQIADGAITSDKVVLTWYEDYSTTEVETTSSSPVSTGVSVTFSCEDDCTALIMHRGVVRHSSQDGRVDVRISVDGTMAFGEFGHSNSSYPGPGHYVSGSDFVNLAPGEHTVEVQFYCYTSGTCYYYGTTPSDWEHLNVLVFSQP